MRRGTVAAAVVLLALVSGCGTPGAESPPAPEPPVRSTDTPAGASSPSPRPTTTPDATATPPTPTRAPDRRRDQAAVREVLVDAADLGDPWVAADQTGDAAEACPGEPSAVAELPFLGSGRRDLIKGRGELVNAVSIALDTLPSTDASAVRDAWTDDTEACRQHADAYDYYVVMAEAGPDSAENADEIVFSRVERVYFDDSRDQLAYARQVVVARTGRVVTTVRHTFLTTEADPTGKDFAPTQKLLAVQLGKVAEEFPA
jgi:hypothetical protein